MQIKLQIHAESTYTASRYVSTLVYLQVFTIWVIYVTMCVLEICKVNH